MPSGALVNQYIDGGHIGSTRKREGILAVSESGRGTRGRIEESSARTREELEARGRMGAVRVGPPVAGIDRVRVLKEEGHVIEAF